MLCALLLALAACQSGAAPEGTAIQPVPVTWDKFVPVPPGQEMGVLDVDLLNQSSSPVTLTSVAVSGPGVGTIGRILRVEIAPVDHTSNVDSALFETDPPAEAFEGGVCRVQRLYPVRGFKLAPGALVRVWVVIRFERAGFFRLDGYRVTYVASRTVQQWLPYSFQTSVQAGANPHGPEKYEQPCLRMTTPLAVPTSGTG